MAITLKSTDSVKFKTDGILATKLYTINSGNITGTNSEGLQTYSRGVEGRIVSVTPITSGINTCLFSGNTFSGTLKSGAAAYQEFSVKYYPQVYKDAYIIKKKDGTTAWAKCKPVTISIGTGIREVEISDETGAQCSYVDSTSGETIYLPCGFCWDIVPIASSLAYNDPEVITIDLSDVGLLTSTDFKSASYHCEASLKSVYTITVPAKSSYINSAKLKYTLSGAIGYLTLTTSDQTIQIDAGTNVQYTSITPQSGYQLSSNATATMTPTSNNYRLRTLTVKPKEPVLTWLIENYTGSVSGYTKQYKIFATNPNDVAVTYIYTYSTSNTPIPSTPDLYSSDSMEVIANMGSPGTEIVSQALRTVPSTLYCKIYIKANTYGIENGIVYTYTKDSSYNDVMMFSNVTLSFYTQGGSKQIMITGINNTNMDFAGLFAGFYVYHGAGFGRTDVGSYIVTNSIPKGKQFTFYSSDIINEHFGYTITASEFNKLIVEVAPRYTDSSGKIFRGEDTVIYGSAAKDDYAEDETTTTGSTLLGEESVSSCSIDIT